MSVPKIVEITHAIYRGLSKRRLCRECVGRKVNNTSGFHLRQNFAFAWTPFLSPRVITWLESVIQSKTQYLVSGQLQKTRGLDELLT